MGTISGPFSIPDGLIYHIDPANPKSYIGTGTTIYDLSGNGNTSNFTNGALYQNYQKGVVVVDGNNDYISTPLFNISSAVSVSVWIKNVALDSIVFGASGSGVNYPNSEYIFYYYSNTALRIQGYNAGPFKQYYFSNINLNTWHNLVMTRDASNNMSVYLNGIGSTTGALSYSGTMQMNQIGRYSNFTNQYNAKGSIGEVKIYNRALSVSEVLQNYNASKKRYINEENYVTSNLVVNLDFGDTRCYPGTGNTAYDLSGLGHTASLVNGAAFSLLYGGNISCDGVNDYIEVPTTSNLNFGSDNFSVEYWYRKNSYTSSSNYWGVNKWNSGAFPNTCEWDLSIGNGNVGTGESTAFGIASGNTIFSTNFLPLPYNLSKFNHLMAIRNNDQLQLYYNGQQIYSGTPVGMTTSTSVNNVGRNLRVSNSALNNYYSKANSGIVRIYNKALTAREVSQNYRALLPRFSDPAIITDGLLLDYDFGSIETNRRAGSSAFNIAGTAYTGTLVNSPTYGTGGGGTLVINGTNQYVSSNDPGISLPLTISVWIYFNALSGWNTFVSQDTTLAVPRAKFYFQRANANALAPIIPGRINFSLTKSDGDVWVVNSNANPTSSTWINYTVTITSSQMRLYQDGVLQESLSDNFSLQAGSGSVLYGSGYYSDTVTDYSNLEFSRILIYNRALSESEIAQNFNNMRNRFGV